MDTAIALWAAGLPRIPWLDGLMAFITNLDEKGFIWILICALLIAWKPTRRTGLACLLALALVAVLSNCVIKPLVARPRPYVALGLPLLIPPPGGTSFPSAHAASSFASATVLFLRCRGWIGRAAMALAAAIAFSRIFFTVHYFSDVAAGTILGILCALLVLRWFPPETVAKHTK